MSSSQLKALLIKNFNLIAKQKATLVCQIITPVICLAFVFLIQYIIEDNIGKTSFGMKMDFPYLFNLPILKNLDDASGPIPLKIDNCDEWYLFDFDDDTPEEDKQFFGMNEGELPEETTTKIETLFGVDAYKKWAGKLQTTKNIEDSMLVNIHPNNPIYNEVNKSGKVKNTSLNTFFGFSQRPFHAKSSGILKSQTNVYQTVCDYTLKMSPYFKQTEMKGENRLNQDLFNRLKALNQIDYDLLKDGVGISVLPDGALQISRANEKELKYRIQINDNRFPFYHKNNGVTRVGLGSGQGDTKKLLTVVNGALWLSDLVNKAYIKHFHPELNIVSGVQFMPFELDNSENVQRVINFAGASFYPLAISLLMPLFMYTIVLEKESKLVEIMKINGMKMRNYWLSLYIFNLIIYAVTFLLFFIFGCFVFKFSIFTETSWGLQTLLYIGWGFCQIGLAFFFQAFLSNARTSTSKSYLIM